MFGYDFSDPLAHYDRMLVEGQVTLDEGGLVHPIVLFPFPRGNSVFHIISSPNTIDGLLTPTPSRVDNSLTLFWKPEQSYTPELDPDHPYNFDLAIRRNYTNEALHLNYKQFAVGTMLNSVANTVQPFSDLDNVLHVIDYIPTAGKVGDAFKQISPEKSQALADLSFMGAALQTQTLSRRITNLRYGIDEDLGGAGGLSGAYKLGPCWGIYIDPAGILGSRSTTMDRTGYDFSAEGFTAGIDYKLCDTWLLGLATGFTHANANFNGSGGTAENNCWPISIYSAYMPNCFYAFGTLGYALNMYNLERQIGFSSPTGSISRTASSSPNGNQFNAYGEAGYDLKAKPFVFTPMVSLGYSRLWIDSFTETGADSLNLSVSKQDVESFQTGVGAKVAVPCKVGGAKVVPQVYGTWQHEFSNDKRGIESRLAQGSSTFAWMSEGPTRNFAKVGASATVFFKKDLSAHLNYNAEVGGGGGNTTHFINAGLRYQF